jgi:uncharacterized membrane protein
VDFPEVARLLLRVSHAVAAAVWLGGGAYYVLALRPAAHTADANAREVARAAQKEFGEWASVATIVMIVTGVVLMFDRLTDGRGSTLYVLWLALKVVAAVSAFWLTGSIARSRRRGRSSGPSSAINRAWMVLTLGMIAFVVGVALSSVYPTGVGQR